MLRRSFPGSATSGVGDESPTAAVDIRLDEELTVRTARRFCCAVSEALTRARDPVRVHLETVKSVDPVGIAALLRAVRIAASLSVAISVLPSAAVYWALFAAGVLDDIPLVDHRATPSELGPPVIPEPQVPEQEWLACTSRLGLRPPTWDELGLFERWAQDPLLDQMMGSELLYLCRHAGPYHPAFTARVFGDPVSLTVLVQPSDRASEPVGFIRLYNINLAERFGFLETAIVRPRPLKSSWGIEASRLFLAYAMDTLELDRVESKVYAYNVLSANALRRNGFRQEGVLRAARRYDGRRWDMLVFAILRDELVVQRARDGFPPMGLWPGDAHP